MSEVCQLPQRVCLCSDGHKAIRKQVYIQVGWLALLIRMRDVLGSNIYPWNVYTGKEIHAFSPPQRDCWGVVQILSNSLHTIALQFDTT
jgi:hypothetical protein